MHRWKTNSEKGRQMRNVRVYIIVNTDRVKRFRNNSTATKMHENYRRFRISLCPISIWRLNWISYFDVAQTKISIRFQSSKNKLNQNDLRWVDSFACMHQFGIFSRSETPWNMERTSQSTAWRPDMKVLSSVPSQMNPAGLDVTRSNYATFRDLKWHV